ncbi:bifunctional DNA-formamidopyrimidine glycosylase/DNA-(apurinic or apyrimidinic site) lyase [Usitatibacter palustris]|uniref:Formamidopyrimidine-DNA glycosylase n=1 Tax=Usitatibacter palustris TaxID=2732487 RepID=A0A6M4H2B8_9PROT|nr:bifunctional DNA-formamidopyrimidine glycosylase/DNA-(apurinic or apyrimidinic site) lyase [Usitatibacter palustris]QJR13636.1 Formamidopyrimidine-DNA glycosylase [Usitatibacter palustris]
MPELPEVETTRRGLLPHVVGRTIREVIVRNPRLRWPVPRDLAARLRDVEILAIRRKGKYLLFDCAQGHLLVHLGMSGRLTLVPADRPPQTHDHIDLRFEGNQALRLTDPRRFGAMLWLKSPAERHALLAGLGLEPLEPEFTGAALAQRARGRQVAVKQFLMNGRIVTGVGNIYASEALFHAGIHPTRAAGRISGERWDRLATSVRETLNRALRAGGTTLRDYASADGQAGGFQFEVAVYDRAGEPCRSCGTLIKTMRQGARATYYCPACQH